MPAFELLEQEITYTGRAFTVRRDHLRTPRGQVVKYDIIQHIGSVILVPIDAEGNVHFVRQYRHAAGLDLLELPAGTLEPGEDPAESAAREIREEIGMAAQNLTQIGQFYLAPGYSTELMRVYLATGLQPNPLEADSDEYLDVVRLPLAEAYRMAAAGELPDAKSLAALLLAQKHLS